MNWREFKFSTIPVQRLVPRANQALAVMLLLTLLGGLFFYLKSPPEITIPQEAIQRSSLPKGSFTWQQEAYDSIGKPALALHGEPPSLLLPDLRQIIVFHGSNQRPDADPDTQRLHLSLRSAMAQPEMASVSPGKPLFLEYEQKGRANVYTFSPENKPTPLWISLEKIAEGAEVSVFLRGPEGQSIQTPDEYHRFSLEEKTLSRFRAGSWKIGDFRVDGSLLARQRARWYGRDYFLEEHGGEAYAEVAGKERIEFGENEERYVIFATIDDFLVWDGERWQMTPAGPESWNKPLLQVKKIEERMMGLEIWDAEGKTRLPINLIRARELWRPELIENELRFVGARTRSQTIVEILGNRMILRPQDWLLRTSDGWIKLDSIQAIDDYVDRKLIGELFVFDGIVKKDGQPVLQGHFFNSSRSSMQYVELGTQGRDSVIYSKESQEEAEPSVETPIKREEKTLDEIREERRRMREAWMEERRNDQIQDQEIIMERKRNAFLRDRQRRRLDSDNGSQD